MKKSIFTFLISFAICALFVAVSVNNRSNWEKLLMEQLIMEKSMRLDDVISKLLYKTEALSALVIQANGKIENFDRIAGALIDDPSILNFLLAPDGIVSNVYPLNGNEAVLGLNFFSEGAGNKEAVMAKENGELVFGGPFNLIQGGQALVGRLPVYIDTPEKGEIFWGLVSVTLKYPDALSGAGLDEIEKDGVSYIIWRINPDDNEKQIIATGTKYNDKHSRYIEMPVHILNADWYFRIAPIKNWYEYLETWLLTCGGILISVLIAFIVRKNTELRIAVSKSARLAEELYKASSAKSAFLANINHEIRTPMSGIIGFAELAASDGSDPEKVKDYLDKIKASADGLMGIIDEILDISKIENEDITLENKLFNIFELLSICVAICNLKAKTKGLSLTANKPEIFKMLKGDSSKLRRILLNLLSNAVKFTNEGFVKLDTKVVERSGSYVKIEFKICDSGIGMETEQIESALNAFTQADNTSTRKYGGVGLGLTIANNYIEQMGGSLVVDSAPGKGSVFSFVLSFEESEESLSSKLLERSEKKQFFCGDILVCEDNETNQMVIQEHLAKLGVYAEIAPNGKAGVELVKSRILAGNPFDIIFMDIQMPVMDGLRAAKLLEEIGSKTPIIALTANIMTDDLERYKTYGINEYLSKPLRMHELNKCLLKHLTPINEKKPAVIDKTEGIEQYDGDEAVYKKILKSFIKNNNETFKNLSEAIKTGNIKQAHITAHSLKGAAGAVGAKRLANAAYGMENALKTYPEIKTFEAQLRLLENEFNAVFEEYDKTSDIETDLDNISYSIIDRDKILELISKLTPYLETGNSKSLEYLDELTKAFRPAADMYTQLITQMELYDFEQAYETIKKIENFMKQNG